jgi:MFS family permease
VLWLVGADLRLTVLAVPPVLPLIHREFALSERAIGALSGLPPLLFGLAAVPGSLLIAKLGARRAAIAALLLVAAGSAARGIGPSVAMLFAMTGIMSVGGGDHAAGFADAGRGVVCEPARFRDRGLRQRAADRRSRGGGADDTVRPNACWR